MIDIPLPRREYDVFVSYASEDEALAEGLANWLVRSGLAVWFDKNRLGAGSPVLEELTRQVCNTRACVLLATNTALTKNYVKHEIDIACEQQVTQPGYLMVAARTDPQIDPRQRFPALRKLGWLDLPKDAAAVARARRDKPDEASAQGPLLDIACARRLLQSVTPRVIPVPDTRHVFVSCGWGEAEKLVTRRLCTPLAALGVRLVGDSPERKHFGEEGRARVGRIMSGCTGHLMILPDRRPPGRPPEETYKYFLAEQNIGRRLGLPRRTFCVSRSALPLELQAEAIEVGPSGILADAERELVALHDETEVVSPYSFLATDFKLNTDRNAAAQDIAEHVLGMDCFVGRDYVAEQLREAIVEKLAGANLVFADLACTRDEATGRLRPNVNTCIEAGIALGARRPVFVMALDPKTFDPTITDRTTQVPFMFRNSQINWYDGDADYLAMVHKLTMATRRRILNDEIASTI